MTHHHTLRVYYEDTDLGGIVYYANYLRFIERARSEWIAALGIDQRRMLADEGLIFAVRRVEADYLRPATLWDDLTVATDLRDLTGARVVLHQTVLRGEEVLFRAVVTLVCLTRDGRPARMPQDLKTALAG